MSPEFKSGALRSHKQTTFSRGAYNAPHSQTPSCSYGSLRSPIGPHPKLKHPPPPATRSAYGPGLGGNRYPCHINSAQDKGYTTACVPILDHVTRILLFIVLKCTNSFTILYNTCVKKKHRILPLTDILKYL